MMYVVDGGHIATSVVYHDVRCGDNGRVAKGVSAVGPRPGWVGCIPKMLVSVDHQGWDSTIYITCSRSQLVVWFLRMTCARRMTCCSCVLSLVVSALPPVEVRRGGFTAPYF
jgi:hypothetical protein